jgi:uncharacterized protein YndB with AHSA1/START domain
MTEHPYDIEVTRVFDAPPERVYQAEQDRLHPSPQLGDRTP